ncbi:MAG: type II toxin-antitoxin system VapC family toxin [Lachnospiraceae bacterium]|nr:type II toxin-antitoxin system VapC family toxin [Oscillospiraceae bacterium]MBR1813401.1 type II toxin-antitoxin system VapC family toxin [Lachnospiraceae bacterium]
MYLLDTNICAYLMRGQYPALNQKILTIPLSELAISSVTLFELEYGAAKANWGEQRMEDMRLFLSAFQVIPFTANDAVVTGRIRAYLVKKGLPIGSYDIQIAGQGVSRGITVVTHNTGEFSRVPGISLEDWVL